MLTLAPRSLSNEIPQCFLCVCEKAARKFAFLHQFCPKGLESLRMRRQPDGAVGMRKCALEICVFPASDRAHRNLIRHSHVALANQAASIGVPVGSVLEPRVCRWPCVLGQSTNVQVFS